MELDTVEQIARLARLKIDQSEAEQLQGELSRILDLMAQLEVVDTQGVPAMAHPFDAEQPLRADEITETNQRDVLMQGAPAIADGLFLVPQVLDN